MILKLLTGAPIWVWPLFIFLLFSGIKATKTRIVYLYSLLIPAIIFSIISTKSVISIYGFNPIILNGFVIASLIGMLIGIKITNKIEVTIKPKKSMLVPGSLIPLITSMIIFINKFFIGAISAIYPESYASIIAIPLLISVFASGIFTGRALTFWKKYITAK